MTDRSNYPLLRGADLCKAAAARLEEAQEALAAGEYDVGNQRLDAAFRDLKEVSGLMAVTFNMKLQLVETSMGKGK